MLPVRCIEPIKPTKCAFLILLFCFAGVIPTAAQDEHPHYLMLMTHGGPNQEGQEVDYISTPFKVTDDSDEFQDQVKQDYERWMTVWLRIHHIPGGFGLIRVVISNSRDESTKAYFQQMKDDKDMNIFPCPTNWDPSKHLDDSE